MKGLILKDLYSVKAYFKIFIIIDLFMIAAAAVSKENSFFIYYPCILSGMVAVSLISYEEKEKWNVFVQTLPYKRSQIVSGKYITSLLISLITVSIISISQMISMAISSVLDIESMLLLSSVLLAASLIPPAVMMPFVYKYGIEKGRMAYYIVIGGFCGIFGVLGSKELDISALSLIQKSCFPILIALISVIIYVVSWFLSVVFYTKKR